MTMTLHIQGSGLYHFRGSVIASRSFCELTVLFTVSLCAFWLKKSFPTIYPPSITTTLQHSLLGIIASFPGPMHGESLGMRLMLCWNESLFSSYASFWNEIGFPVIGPHIHSLNMSIGICWHSSTGERWTAQHCNCDHHCLWHPDIHRLPSLPLPPP